MDKEKYVLFSVLAVVLILAFYIIFNLMLDNKSKNFVDNKKQLQTIIDNQNNVEFQITPLSASEFDISINTHSIELDFDLTKISTLYDDTGNTYKPLQWEGSAPGGHHRSGILKFSSVNNNAKSIKLVIIDNTTREFIWELKWQKT